jgi:hypothetical protein
MTVLVAAVCLVINIWGRVSTHFLLLLMLSLDLQALSGLLDGVTTFHVPGRLGGPVSVGHGFQFVATQNPSGGEYKRHTLPPSIRSRFLDVAVPSFDAGQVTSIVMDRDDSGYILPPVTGLPTSGSFAQLNFNDAQSLGVAYELLGSGGAAITLRELIKVVRRHRVLGSSVLDALLSVTLPRYLPHSAFFNVTLAAANQAFRVSVTPADLMTYVPITRRGGGMQLEVSTFCAGPGVCLTLPSADLNWVAVSRQQEDLLAQEPQVFQRALARLVVALHMREPVLLVGSSSYKTLLHRTWCQLFRRGDCLVSFLTPTTEVSTLVGTVKPFSSSGAVGVLCRLVRLLMDRWQALGDGSRGTVLGDLSEVQTELSAVANGMTRSEEAPKQQASGHDGTDSTEDNGAWEEDEDDLAADVDVDFDLLLQRGIASDQGSSLSQLLEKALTRMSSWLSVAAKPCEVESVVCSDSTIRDVMHKAASLTDRLLEAHRSKGTNQGSSPYFFEWVDGPVSASVKRGSVLVLEDFNAPRQVVAERVNSVLETEPSFYVSEDSSVPINESQKVIPPLLFRTVATVHQPSPEAPLGISPATRSRFTEVAAEPYSRQELVQVLRMVYCAQATSEQFRCGTLSGDAASHVVSHSLLLLAEVKACLWDWVDNPVARFKRLVEGPHASALYLTMFRAMDYVTAPRLSDPSSPAFTPLASRVVHAARFLFATSDGEAVTREYHGLDGTWLLRLSNTSLPLSDPRHGPCPCATTMLRALCSGIREAMARSRPLLQELFSSVQVAWSPQAASHLRDRLMKSSTYNTSAPAHLNTTSGVVHAAFGGVVAMAYPDAEGRVPLTDRVRVSGLLALSSVNSTQVNVARILFALESNSPVMLTSPPGVGKTKTAQVVGELITGLPLCRVSFSAETSVESLFGQIMPSAQPVTILNPLTGLNETRYVRLFVWRDGIITAAIRAGSSPPLMLWDEVNLAPPEVLDALAPLLARDRHMFRIPGKLNGHERCLCSGDAYVVCCLRG